MTIDLPVDAAFLAAQQSPRQSARAALRSLTLVGNPVSKGFMFLICFYFPYSIEEIDKSMKTKQCR